MFIMLKNLYIVEWYVLSWTICTLLNDLYYVGWFVQHVEWFALCQMICTMLSDLYFVKWFVIRWKIGDTLGDLR